jgi:hypothetical protein
MQEMQTYRTTINELDTRNLGTSEASSSGVSWSAILAGGFVTLLSRLFCLHWARVRPRFSMTAWSVISASMVQRVSRFRTPTCWAFAPLRAS